MLTSSLTEQHFQRSIYLSFVTPSRSLFIFRIIIESGSNPGGRTLYLVSLFFYITTPSILAALRVALLYQKIYRPFRVYDKTSRTLISINTSYQIRFGSTAINLSVVDLRARSTAQLLTIVVSGSISSLSTLFAIRLVNIYYAVYSYPQKS